MSKLPLVLLAAALLFGACDGASPRPPSHGASDSPSGQPTVAGDPVDHIVVDVLSAPAVGAPTSIPTYIGDRLALLRYLEQFRGAGERGNRFAADIEKSVGTTKPRPGYTLVATVVGSGCEAVDPQQVEVRLIGRVLDITGPPPRTDVECVAAITSVAVVQVPKDVVQLPKDETRTPDGAPSATSAK